MSHDGLIHPAKDCPEQIAALQAQVQTLREALATIKIETGSSTLQWHIADAALAATEPKETK